MINRTECGIYYYGPTLEEGVLTQARNHFTDDRCVYMGVMADNHLGFSTPIGGVVAYRNAISLTAVGLDIACGNKAVKLNIKASDIHTDLNKLADEIFSKISFGIGRTNNERVEDSVFEDSGWKLPLPGKLKELAVNQFGTIGSGNHYVDVFKDEEDFVWIGVHFGSRGFGHTVAKDFLKKLNVKEGYFEIPTVLDVSSELGSYYLQCMELAGKYTYAARSWVCSKVASILGGTITEEVHNHHNFAFRETHFGDEYWVVRKGSTPAFPGQKGFVGGSMGDNSVILEGVDHPECKSAFYSTVHGAGRAMGRMEAKGKYKPVKDEQGNKTGEIRCIKEARITNKEMHDWLTKKNVILRGGDVDESPLAYKRLDEVLDYHKNTVRILHTLSPLIVCMAPSRSHDPYKD